MSQTLVKQPSESRLYGLDFSLNLAPGETIDSVVSVTAAPSGLTLSEEGITTGLPGVADAKGAQVRIAGGTDGQSHKVTGKVTTSDGNTLEGDGILLVKQL